MVKQYIIIIYYHKLQYKIVFFNIYKNHFLKKFNGNKILLYFLIWIFIKIYDNSFHKYFMISYKPYLYTSTTYKSILYNTGFDKHKKITVKSLNSSINSRF